MLVLKTMRSLPSSRALAKLMSPKLAKLMPELAKLMRSISLASSFLAMLMVRISLASTGISLASMGPISLASTLEEGSDLGVVCLAS